jgi:hypothetical protein
VTDTCYCHRLHSLTHNASLYIQSVFSIFSCISTLSVCLSVRVIHARIHASAHPEFFIGGGGRGPDPETVCNLRLILKIML